MHTLQGLHKGIILQVDQPCDELPLQTGMSYEDLISLWYSIAVDLQTNQSTIFANSDPSLHQAALEQKLTDIGLDPNVARSIVDYIISQIQN